MKTQLFIAAILFSSSALASPYFVDSMTCVGQIKGQHGQVHPSYNFIVTKFTSFKSKRKTGGYANSLRIANDYAETPSGLSKDPGGEVWYMSSLQQSGDRVTHPNGECNFTIMNVRGSQHLLKGTYKMSNSVAGNGYWYEMSCKADVVREPTRISDHTASKL